MAELNQMMVATVNGGRPISVFLLKFEAIFEAL